MDLLTEFFYEFRRFVPGLVLISLYYHKEVLNEVSAHRDLTIVILSACLLVIAWLLGFAIELLMGIVAHFGWRYGGKKVVGRIRTIAKLKKSNHLTSHAQLTGKLTSENRLRQLAFAERQMSRSLWPILFASSIHCESFTVFPWHWYFGLLGALVFGLCWLWGASDPNIKRDNDELLE